MGESNIMHGLHWTKEVTKRSSKWSKKAKGILAVCFMCGNGAMAKKHVWEKYWTAIVLVVELEGIIAAQQDSNNDQLIFLRCRGHQKLSLSAGGVTTE